MTFQRGPNQKVIGFSFFDGDSFKMEHGEGNRHFFDGILSNLKLIPQFYPGWIMRLYHDLNENDSRFKRLCEMACNYDYLDICNSKNLPGVPIKDASKIFGMDWRFFPVLDPQVIIFLLFHISQNNMSV